MMVVEFLEGVPKTFLCFGFETAAAPAGADAAVPDKETEIHIFFFVLEFLRR